MTKIVYKRLKPKKEVLNELNTTYSIEAGTPVDSEDDLEKRVCKNFVRIGFLGKIGGREKALTHAIKTKLGFTNVKVFTEIKQIEEYIATSKLDLVVSLESVDEGLGRELVLLMRKHIIEKGHPQFKSIVYMREPTNTACINYDKEGITLASLPVNMEELEHILYSFYINRLYEVLES
jgi:hypothetical protein